MTSIGIVLGSTLLALTFFRGAAADQGPAQNVASLLSAARAATGGAQVKSFRLRGKRNGATEMSSFPIEIAGLWPDHYYRTTQLLSERTVQGFARSVLLGVFVPPSDENPTAPTHMERVALQRQTFAALVLLLFARTDTALALTPGQSTTRTPTGPVVTFTGPQGFTIRATFDAATSVPIQVERDVELRAMSGKPLGRLVPVTVAAIGLRSVAGVSVPSMLRTTQDGVVIGEVLVESIERDVSLDPNVFLQLAPQDPR